MNTKQAVIQHILAEYKKIPTKSWGESFAPSNIALCKYWGKRDSELNLPMTSSLSISLAHKGAQVKIALIDSPEHELIINGKIIDNSLPHAKRLLAFLDNFIFDNAHRYQLTLCYNIPVAAGLASSACTFAAIVKALNDLYQWQLDHPSLSILARLGSGSAARSIDVGFVEWQRGNRSDGMDSYAVPLNQSWPELNVGLSMIQTNIKSVSSREGMKRTLQTSPLYAAWPQKIQQDLTQVKKAIAQKNFDLFGKTAESNALAMHATMHTAWPPLMYSHPETITMMKRVWELRDAGLTIYFTQDAGPNLKLLFLDSDITNIKTEFPDIEIISPFKKETINA